MRIKTNEGVLKKGESIMSNYDKRIQELNIDKLIHLEDEILECGECYCRDFCETKQRDKSTCAEVRREWLSMESKGITYTLCGNYYYPDLKLPAQESKPVGIYGKRHGEYLRENKKVLYYNMLTSGKLSSYLAEINEQAITMKENLIANMKQAENVTEALKETDMLAWVQTMNSIRSRTDEIVNRELIFK